MWVDARCGLHILTSGAVVIIKRFYFTVYWKRSASERNNYAPAVNWIIVAVIWIGIMVVFWTVKGENPFNRLTTQPTSVITDQEDIVVIPGYAVPGGGFRGVSLGGGFRGF